MPGQRGGRGIGFLFFAGINWGFDWSHFCMRSVKPDHQRKKAMNVEQRRIIGDTALSRRDFGKLTMAAFGGMVLGTALAGYADKGGDAKDPSPLLGDHDS